MALADLLSIQTANTLLNWSLDAAAALGLPVTSWRAGDPSRTLFTVVAERLFAYEQLASAFVGSGFLDEAEGDWLTEHAAQRFFVTRGPGSAAAVVVRLTNGGGGVFVLGPGDVTVAQSVDPSITYRNVTGGTLLAGVGKTLDLDFVCDVIGSAGSADVGDIDTMVTTLLKVTCSNTEATEGTDEESDDALRARCRASFAALSPNGPAAAYEYVALSSALTGTSEPTRVTVLESSVEGHVAVYVTSADGSISSGAVDAVEAAIVQYATPLTVTPNVEAAVAVPVNVEYGVDVRASSGLTADDVRALVTASITEAINARPISDGEDYGTLALSVLVAAIHAAHPDIYRASVLDPAADVELAEGEVATVGTVTDAEINFT